MSSVSEPLTDLCVDELNELVVQATEQALSMGILMNDKTTQAIENAPFVLLPSPVPRACFETALQLAPLFNTLIDRVSRDSAYLVETLTPAAGSDDFVRRQLDVLRAAVIDDDHYRRCALRTAALGLHRSDYMVHQPDSAAVLQQVEINTISAAFAALGTAVADLHRFVCSVRPALRAHYLPDASLPPPNQSDAGHARLLAAAHRLYGAPDAVVLIVVLPRETNLFDQRKLEYLLWRQHGVRCVRRSLDQIAAGLQLDPDSRVLSDPAAGDEIAVVYYRAAYMPEHHASDGEWAARLMIERATAVKCPTIGYQLAGLKKIQQDLALPGRLERFFPDDPAAVAALRACFAGLYPTDDAAALAAALRSPGDYVLKPQREGGGNNLYDDQLHHALSTFTKEQLDAYILMTRIRPRSYPMYFVRRKQAVLAQGVSELGIYSGYLATDALVLENQATGYLLRSKSVEHNDGGVAAGVACLDSPWLV